jgi:NADH-quinone oxidoreductase subunit C
VCKTALGMDYFCFLSGLDWMPNPGLSGEKLWDPAETAPSAENGESGSGYETGVAGGASRFQVFARLYNTRAKVGITLKADLDETNPEVESWVPTYRGADWHEREAWEMYGFLFTGHPDLRHIYLPADFEGFPLRKDFPLLSREVKPWPGLVDKEPIPGEEDEGDAAAGGEAS